MRTQKTAQETAQETTQETAQETAQETTQETAQETAQPIPPESAQVAVQRNAPESAQEHSPLPAAVSRPLSIQPIWEQQPGEPRLWHGRFQVYLRVGPARTLRAASRACSVLDPDPKGAKAKVGGDWSQTARAWHWQARALAYDAHQRDLLALSERNVRLGLRQRRLAVIEETLEQVRATLDSAHLDEADETLARQWLPQLRVFLRDLLAAEREEFTRRPYAADDPDAAPITADDLRAAQRQLDEQGQLGEQGQLDEQGQLGRHGQLGGQGQLDGQARSPAGAGQPAPNQPAPGQPAPGQPATNRPATETPPTADWTSTRLLVCVGADPGLMLDLAVLRAVRATTGLQFLRVLNVTRAKFAATLRRERGLHRPVRLVHMALHTSAQGIEFADGPADGNWLSEQLSGADVLLLASCAGDDLGDWLGVVPYVISFNEAISHEDAAALAHHFWQQIGLGRRPGEALDTALSLCAPAVAEYVVRHW